MRKWSDMPKMHEVLPSGLRVDRMWWFKLKFCLMLLAGALMAAGAWAMLF